MGLPRLPSSMFHWIFHEINHLFWGTPMTSWKAPNYRIASSIHPSLARLCGQNEWHQDSPSVPASHLFDSRRASDVLQFGAQFDAGGFDGWKFDEVLGTCHAGFFWLEKPGGGWHGIHFSPGSPVEIDMSWPCLLVPHQRRTARARELSQCSDETCRCGSSSSCVSERIRECIQREKIHLGLSNKMVVP